MDRVMKIELTVYTRGKEGIFEMSSREVIEKCYLVESIYENILGINEYINDGVINPDKYDDIITKCDDKSIEWCDRIAKYNDDERDLKINLISGMSQILILRYLLLMLKNVKERFDGLKLSSYKIQVEVDLGNE